MSVLRPALPLALAALLVSAASAEPMAAQDHSTHQMEPAMTATEFTSIDGKPLDLATLGAKAVLVVNTASKCGYTPQYAGLEELYEAYKDKGLVIVGVPSNDFGGQEPGTEAEVKTFCQINYGVTFPLTRKYKVTGAEEHPFYVHAVETLGDAAQPKWNFHKVLTNASGTPIKAYPSATKPADAELVADIEAALKG
ncbi:glutathione peroxidase [Hyphomonas oceanitis]|uniref:Glutathione peroxidase n=1 Tax=Hyphomonas oceanitis SCH89 TaxID=1280953 RepID=A0A059G8L2_9PROT|nr:glutathione peroxidase [Hyphomonas oceanitis]KDA03197.1 glutathione peroxidase [Hyphomonas oceanitis SCH89]